MNLDLRHSKVIERFEKMMDTLQDAGIIQAWQYTDLFKNWRQWLELKIVVEPPQEIIDQYKKIKSPHKNRPGPSPRLSAKPSSSDIAQRLKSERLKRNLTQMQAAEEIGIDQSTLSKLENGHHQGDRKTLQRIAKWLKSPSTIPSILPR